MKSIESQVAVPAITETRKLSRWSSFRGRYLLGATLLSLLLTGVAFGGWLYVRTITSVQLARIETRMHATAAVEDLSDQVRELESRVQRFLISPGAAQHQAVAKHLALQEAAWSRLADSEWAHQDDDILRLLQALHADLQQLQQEDEALLRTHADVDDGVHSGTAIGEPTVPAKGGAGALRAAPLALTPIAREPGGLLNAPAQAESSEPTALRGTSVNTAAAQIRVGDLRTAQKRLDPILRRVEQRLAELGLELGVGSARDITLWTKIAQQLSTFVIIMAGLAVLAVAAAYFLFDRLLLEPIAHVTRALHAEAKGSAGPAMPGAIAREMSQLVSAFNEMRRQVRSRQARLDHIAHHDPLTQLPNRTLFRDRLEHALAIAERNQNLVGVMFLDLDRFKQINDSLGHAVGDRLLLAAADRLWEVMRTGDTVARLGGDEFAVIVEGITHVDQLEGIAHKIVAVFEAPFAVDGRSLHISCSVGVALCPLDERDADALIRDADLAMYGAKEMGRNTYRFFSADMTSRVQRNLELETALREAVEQQQLQLYFQPIVNLRQHTICGCEALLRWLPSDRTAVSPCEFVPLLEETGLIVEVTRWVVREVELLHERIAQQHLKLEAVSVNLTARLLHSHSFMEMLTATLADSVIPANTVILEITEDTLVRDFRSAETALAKLKALGVRVALDDFGTGQSSLNHLRSFPIDLVKIDRDFVLKVPEDRYDSDLVRAIIAMADSLGMMVVAEGVETTAQLDFLQRHGCHHVQGYLFGEPMPADAFVERLAQGLEWPADSS